ncbi:unnamed protein product [Didymodactylos carnosus]|uniref:Cationic amino acid transporter C-terminal domain-containing protein n=1 Tax=Didymodactylos carnosus TaxID=1234261 RepID=A0A814CPA4_9BILA|nr:unnamed protein product [Didymodactylos carnosus]CAF0943531.1 unnamed protein product [Didymodactylos carnosus]CAF3670771.1 unnamed protein product [Didymodactylos carnosus]CAF3719798.1 unnamed protein product [Didymodactylos carnosus]
MAGIYVVVGTVARDTAGAGITLSFLLSGIVAFLTAISYAEFGVVKSKDKTNLPHPDALGAIIIIVVTILLSIGVKESAYVNNVFTIINIATIFFIIVFGFTIGSTSVLPWKSEYYPFGMMGVLQGAAQCFYAFTGFEAITVASEEVINPKRNVPVGILSAMFATCLLYIFASTALTMLVPYYKISTEAPFAAAIAERGYPWAKNCIAIGTTISILSPLLASLYTLPRCIFAMSNDGLLFETFGRTTQNGIPFKATLLSGFMSAIIVLFTELKQLVEFVNVLTLVSYVTVNISIIMIRYVPCGQMTHHIDIAQELLENDKELFENVNIFESKFKRDCISEQPREIGTIKRCFHRLNYSCSHGIGFSIPRCIFIMTGSMLCFSITIIHLRSFLSYYSFLFYTLLILLATMTFISLGTIALHTQTMEKVNFQVPWVPILPSIAIWCNLFLVIWIPAINWIYFVIWNSIGLMVYFLYGVNHSKENYQPYSDFANLINNQELIKRMN